MRNNSSYNAEVSEYILYPEKIVNTEFKRSGAVADGGALWL